MEYIIILVVFLIIVFGLYKLCTYLNKDNTNRKNRMNNVILKAGVVYILIFILLMIIFGLHGYYNGGRNPACSSLTDIFCYNFDILGFVFNIFNYLWFGIIIFILFLIYIIIYKSKYKKKIFKNRFIYLGEAIAIGIISMFLYISNTNFKYEVNIFNTDGFIYNVEVFDNKIKVLKKEVVPCTSFDSSNLEPNVAAPYCPPKTIFAYQIDFSDYAMNQIYDYIDQLFSDEKSSKDISFSDNLDPVESNILRSLIYNDEKYLDNLVGLLVSYDYEITTDLIYRTTSNDGGSYHNEYYLVSFTEGKIEKYEDVYIGFQGFKYKDRFLYQKDIPDDMKNELKTLLDRLVIEEDVNDDNNYSPYVINDNNQEKRIYNSESIRLLEDIFNRIDSL